MLFRSISEPFRHKNYPIANSSNTSNNNNNKMLGLSVPRPSRLKARRHRSSSRDVFGVSLGPVTRNGGSSSLSSSSSSSNHKRLSLFAIPPDDSDRKKRQRSPMFLCLGMFTLAVVSLMTLRLVLVFGSALRHPISVSPSSSSSSSSSSSLLRSLSSSNSSNQQKQHQQQHQPPQLMATTSTLTTPSTSTTASTDWDVVLQRALDHSRQCRAWQPANTAFTGFDKRSILPFHNDTVATLPAFGIIDDLQMYMAQQQQQQQHKTSKKAWPVCTLPPEHECQETQFSVVFMAYNPDRLGITLKEIKRLLNPTIFHNWVHEIILVWNGERHVDESSVGQELLRYCQTHPVRIVYPLQMGLPNDLMNRYHPNVVQPQTKALLYYDDDGPFYSPAAIQGGFELWRRHANVQIGAMARQLNYSPRQQKERWDLVGGTVSNSNNNNNNNNNNKHRPDDTKFVSHCTNMDDAVDYNFHYFANYDANVVLPSGSFLHSNYLCFLWHPVLEKVRQFVLLHPVHPDDMTVSMVVSQLAGKAPRVYSRRLNPPPPPPQEKVQQQQQQRRRLSQQWRQLGPPSHPLSYQESTKKHNGNQDSAEAYSGSTADFYDYHRSNNPNDSLGTHHHALVLGNDSAAYNSTAKDYYHHDDDDDDENKYPQKRAKEVVTRRDDDNDKDYDTTHSTRAASHDDGDHDFNEHDQDDNDNDEPLDWGVVPQSERQRHRALLFSICWDCGAGMTEMKQYWAELRTEAVNALVRYFGSLNSGSIGWCDPDSSYYDASHDGRCHPVMAKQGWLPWMNPDGTPKETCP